MEFFYDFLQAMKIYFHEMLSALKYINFIKEIM